MIVHEFVKWRAKFVVVVSVLITIPTPPQLHETHARAYDLGCFLKHEELPEVVDGDIMEDKDVAYVVTKASNGAPPKKCTTK